MDAIILNDLLWGLAGAVLGGLLFAGIGMIAGTSETATIPPAILLIILLGFPPVACFSFTVAAIAAKHIIHTVPTALLGIPGDTMAVPMLEPCSILRRFGLPHIALQKMVSAGVLASLMTIPISVGFGMLLAPLGDIVKAWSGPLFTIMAGCIAFTSRGKWASIMMIFPLAFIIYAFNKLAVAATGNGVVVSIVLAMSVGPMFVDVLSGLSPVSRPRIAKASATEFWLAPELKNWSGFVPNPLKILTRKQLGYTFLATAVSAITFTFSPIGMTVMIGEAVRSRVKGFYERLTTSISVMNATTESTYLAELIIPLVAFGLPLSPIAMGVGFPLFNAPPVFTLEPLHNLHTLMTPVEFLLYGLMGVIIASALCYPVAMNYAHRASAWVIRNLSQEAILTMFAGLIVVLCFGEAGWVGVTIAVTFSVLCGIMNQFFGMNIGVQFMTFFAAPWLITTVLGIK